MIGLWKRAHSPAMVVYKHTSDVSSSLIRIIEVNDEFEEDRDTMFLARCEVVRGMLPAIFSYYIPVMASGDTRRGLRVYSCEEVSRGVYSISGMRE